MNASSSGHDVLSIFEAADLPAGLDIELFTGPRAPESLMDRRARLDVARAVLAELREQGRDDRISKMDADYAASLGRRRPRSTPSQRQRRSEATGEAA